MNRESVSFWADIKKYEDMLANDPKSYCFTLLSELYRKLGLLDDAINVAKRGIDTHPEYIGGYVAVGRAYFEKGMKEESINALEKVVQVTPENILAQKLLSQMYIDRGDIESAVRTLNVIELLNPEDVESRLMLDALKKPAVGDNVTDGFEAVAPPILGGKNHSDDEGIVFLSEIPEAEPPEERSEVADNLQEIGAFHKTGPLATATLAELYVSQGLLEQAINVYRELLINEPGNGEFKERLFQLNCLISGSGFEMAEQKAVIQEENSDISDIQIAPFPIVEECEFVSGTENADGIISTLECWLENIRRGRNGAERDAQKYC